MITSTCCDYIPILPSPYRGRRSCLRVKFPFAALALDQMSSGSEDCSNCSDRETVHSSSRGREREGAWLVPLFSQRLVPASHEGSARVERAQGLETPCGEFRPRGGGWRTM
ncbi:hypothetical protein M758_UG339500 [Ceratodon purpureus]|nr:hypothetical protein M758_UG339500 [Ceratodon purpureus]